MNIKKVIKRAGVIFIFAPIFIMGLLLHTFTIVTAIIWGPIWYIITGKDPLSEDTIAFKFCESFQNWYFKHFDPEK